MPRPSSIPVLVLDGDPGAIEDFRIVLDPPRDLGGGPDPIGIAFEAELIGSSSAHGRFPGINLRVENNGPAAVEAGRRAVESGQAFRIAFIDIGVPPGHWGLDIAAALRALDSKLHIVLTVSEPGPSPVDLSERIAPADLLSLLHKPLHAPEIEQLILSAEARHLRETSDELARSQARDIAAKALRDLPIGLIVAEPDRRIAVAAGAVSSIFPEYGGGLVPGTYLPEGLAWIAQPKGTGPQAGEMHRSHTIRELNLDDGRCVIAATARDPDGGGMGLFLDVTDQKREEAMRQRHAQEAKSAEGIAAFRRSVNALLREYARSRGRSGSNSGSSSGANGGAGDRLFADQLQDLIERFDAAVGAPAEPDA